MKEKFYEEFKNKYENCKNCELHCLRKNVVIGDGNIFSKLMFVGEAPGEEEDKKGIPFVGKAGKLLRKFFTAAKIDEFYITNIVKCRPPNNRNPSQYEISQCKEILFSQISILSPCLIVTIGAIATNSILENNEKISKLRGKIFKKDFFHIIPIFHPSYLLRNHSNEINSPRWLTFQDMLLIKKKIQELS